MNHNKSKIKMRVKHRRTVQQKRHKKVLPTCLFMGPEMGKNHEKFENRRITQKSPQLLMIFSALEQNVT